MSEDKKEQIDILGALLVEKIKSLSDKTEWKKPWITPQYCLPKNLDGRVYRGMNSFFLSLFTSYNKYEHPIFCTFLQAKSNGLTINKGARSAPLSYFNFDIRNKTTNEKITLDEYNLLKTEEKEEYKVRSIYNEYRVFNIDQTDIREANPTLFNELTSAEKEKKYEHKEYNIIDHMIEHNNWVVPIVLTEGDRAYYSLSTDSITCPLKEQFANPKNYYGTMLHEMAHSTGAADRLNRFELMGRDKTAYAREELVAELTSAFVGLTLGTQVSIDNQNLVYVKSWMKRITDDPNFIKTVLKDVVKSQSFIENHLIDLEKKLSLSNKKELESFSHSILHRIEQITPASIQTIKPQKEEKTLTEKKKYKIRR